MTKYRLLSIFAIALSLAACGGRGKAESTDVKSMEQIHAESGVPVRARALATSDFSVFEKYPTVLRSRSESTAYASLSDVVRSVSVKVGDKVARDQTVITFSADNPQYQQARLSYENAKKEFERSELLFAGSGISKQDFDNIRTQFELARAALKQVGDMVEVKAPIDGSVTRINVRSSENVKPGDALFTVSNQDGFEARFYVTPEEIDGVKVGARARIETAGSVVEGSVTEVSLIMDGDHKAFPATALFARKSPGLVSGKSVDVAVEAYRNERALVVERKELTRSGSGWAAYVVEGGQARRKTVVVGRERGIEMEILEGLRVGDMLITSGTQDIVDGTTVNIVETISSN